MKPSTAPPVLCALCGENPATEEYVLDRENEMVCSPCRERRRVRDALEDNLLHIMSLEQGKQYDEALACLDTILTANRSLDHDGWLANSVALHRTSILYEAGRYAEAEQAYKEWAEIGFIDLWRRQMHALGLAQVLEALGRDAEVPPILESVLGEEEPKDLNLALTVLTELVRFSAKVGVPFNPKWLSVAKAIAEHNGVDMPSAPSPEAVILMLEAAVEALRQQHPDDQ